MADPASKRKAAMDSDSGSGLYVTHRMTSIVGGLVSPLVVLSSFPGLTETWRIIPLPDGEVERLSDPTLLIVGQNSRFSLLTAAADALERRAGLGFSFSFSFISCGLLTVVRLLSPHPRFATLTATLLLTLHVIICLVALSVFASSNNGRYLLSTAFWLTATSAILATSILGFLVGVEGPKTGWLRNKVEKGINGQERSLLLVWTFFASYLLLGTIAFKFVSPTSLRLLRSDESSFSLEFISSLCSPKIEMLMLSLRSTDIS